MITHCLYNYWILLSFVHFLSENAYYDLLKKTSEILRIYYLLFIYKIQDNIGTIRNICKSDEKMPETLLFAHVTFNSVMQYLKSFKLSLIRINSLYFRFLIIISETICPTVSPFDRGY